MSFPLEPQGGNADLVAGSSDHWRNQISKLPPDWRLIPCNAKKQPIDHLTGRLLPEWGSRAVSPQALLSMEGDFFEAVGVVLGPPSGGLLAVDFDNEGYEEQFLSIYGKSLDELPVTMSWTSGRPGRKQLGFQVPKRLWPELRSKKVWMNKDNKTCLELRWSGHQSIVLGAHPETTGYSWVPGCSPSDIAMVAEAPDWLLEPLRIKTRNAPSVDTAPVNSDDYDCSKRLLRLIKPREDYDSWLKVGMALNSVDASLLDDFIEWSRGCANFNEKECIEKWSSFKRDGVGIGTLYYMAKEDGATEADLRWAVGSAQKPEQSASVKPKWGQIIATMLDAIKDGNEDSEMELRARIMCEYRRSVQQVDAALFKLETKNTVGNQQRSAAKSLDLSKIKSLDWLIPGFVVKNDLTLFFGSAGCGKTTGAVGLADALIQGKGFLDHQVGQPPGKVLFIASDSGAPPLLASLQDMNLIDLPAYRHGGPDQRLFVWASDPDQGMVSWDIGLANCLSLRSFVVENSIDLVIIDSCKAVFSNAGIDYADNNLVTAVLTFFKQVICVNTSVLFINHDGREKGAAAGAKAWKEIPSLVHQIKRPDDKANEGASSFREWRCVKNRLGGERQFHYVLVDGVLAVTHATEVVGICIDEIIRCLNESPSGELCLNDFRRLLGASFKFGTIKNSLTDGVKGSKPPLKRVRSKRGYYRLNAGT